MWKVRVTSTGKEMGEVVVPGLSSVAVGVSLRDSVLLELDTTVAASVGRATCSMNSRRLWVSLMSSGSDSMTAERERTPLLTGRCGKGWERSVLGAVGGGGLCLAREGLCWCKGEEEDKLE